MTTTTINLAKAFDQSILRPESISSESIKNACEEAKKYNFRAIVIHPCYVEIVKELLKDSGVLTVSVCDFPHGKGLTKSRAKDIKEILKLGADEIDIVANYQYLIEGNIKFFKRDLKAAAKAMEGKLLKIILETDLLNERLIKTATQVIAKIAKEEDAKLCIKTKTGFIAESKIPNIDAVRVIKKTLENLDQYGEGKILIKASGGIKSKENAIELLNMGAHILGVSMGPEIVQG